jgi:phosphoglucosamine mutase
MRKHFGTDGIRGRAGEELNPELVLRAAYGLTRQGGSRSRAYSSNGRPLIVLGSDPRLSASMLRSAAISGINLGGCDVLDLGTVPTPLVPLMLLRRQAQGGIMITASHNPVEDNGIKFFGADGQKISAKTEEAIEAVIGSPEALSVAGKLHFGQSEEYDASADYLAFVRRAGDKGNGKTIRLVLDCAFGATSRLAPLAFKAAGYKVKSINAEFDGSRCNVGCGATDLSALRAEVVRSKAELGLAFDGDGDRVLAVDHTGQAVSGDKIIAIFATRIRRYREQAGVVMTKMTNLGVEERLEQQGISMRRTEVGDIQVLAAMKKYGLDLGGEQSGHIIMLDKLPSGDGILAGLELAAVIRASGKRLSELAGEYPEYPQVLTNLKVRDKLAWKEDDKLKRNLSGLMARHREVRFYLRPSGTENLIRVLTEARDAEECRASNAAVCAAFEEWSRRAG